MLVSVVTVSFNAAKTIRDTIASVNEQAWESLEHVFIDGLSSDSTLSVIEQSTARSNTIICEADSGIYDAMNKGVAAARGDIIVFLNADDYFISSNAVSQVVAEFQRDENFGIVVGSTVMGGRFVWEPLKPSQRPMWFMQAPHPSMFVKRSALELLDTPFDCRFKICADLDQQMQLIYSKSVKVSILSDVTTYMRQGGVSDSPGSSVASFFESIEIYRKSFGIGGFVFGLQRMVRKLLQRLIKKRG